MKFAFRPAILIWIAFLAACIWIAVRSHYSADLSAFLPRTPTPSQEILVDQLREGVVSQLVLVGIAGAQPETLAAISESLAQQLTQDPLFAYANNGAEQRLVADGQFLLRNRYVLSPGITAQRFTVPGLRDALENDLDLLASPLSTVISSVLPFDPTGEVSLLLDQFQPQGGPQKQHGVWFSHDGSRALLVLQTRAAGFDLDAQEHALARVRTLFEQIVKQQHAPEAALAMSGPAVFAIGSRAAIKQDVSRISTIAIVLVSLLLLSVYRSATVLGLTLLPVATGAAAGIAAVSLVFGFVHGVTLGFGATLLGEGVDYAIYLFTNAAGSSRQSGLARIWPTLRLGVMTSVVGYSVLLMSDFTGLAQLGLFSIAGLIVAFAVTRFVLPNLTPNAFMLRPPAVLGPQLMRAVQRIRSLRWPLIVMIVSSVIWLAVLGGSVWDDRLESLSPVAESDKRLDTSLRAELAAPDVGPLVVIRAVSQQTALEMAEKIGATLDRLQQSGELGGYESPARVLPSDAMQRQRLAALSISSKDLRNNLNGAAGGLPFQPGLFEPFLRDVETAKQAPLLSRQNLNGTTLGLKIDSLLVQRRGTWFALLPLRGVKNAANIAQALQSSEGVHLLDLKHEADALYRGYRGQALTFAAIGAIAIALLLFATLRSMRRVADVLMPLAGAVVVTCALLTLGGHKLTMFHLVGLMLVVGVGSNYTLFFERQTLSRSDPLRTLTSLVLCNTATIIGFGLLTLARAPVLSSIGMTVAIGAFLSLVMAAILESTTDTGGWK